MPSHHCRRVAVDSAKGMWALCLATLSWTYNRPAFADLVTTTTRTTASDTVGSSLKLSTQSTRTSVDDTTGCLDCEQRDPFCDRRLLCLPCAQLNEQTRIAGDGAVGASDLAIAGSNRDVRAGGQQVSQPLTPLNHTQQDTAADSHSPSPPLGNLPVSTIRPPRPLKMVGAYPAPMKPRPLKRQPRADKHARPDRLRQRNRNLNGGVGGASELMSTPRNTEPSTTPRNTEPSTTPPSMRVTDVQSQCRVNRTSGGNGGNGGNGGDGGDREQAHTPPRAPPQPDDYRLPETMTLFPAYRSQRNKGISINSAGTNVAAERHEVQRLVGDYIEPGKVSDSEDEGKSTSARLRIRQWARKSMGLGRHGWKSKGMD
ncbi:hypothetical protein P153DRAFT_146754 [Dothidotthia symphoricarpi CBS 119687]|uniref:Uncharacterized protein n=1 Tax=Dothidotthia symphoricarpi CBS 119687 TaxID=1392245 RepID=A0A6A5ZVN3_9PLEO|nr:uncharacterized protein P153DRAFT_146754 [Dothidotthia symphoricarpi CBS 119687]KAF2123792.1 hypothetical protein P153DRAFT_146754 [Dothidotthia symphoricarpi CBS 119687]